jgi:Icc-related predicted phosphoesterase
MIRVAAVGDVHVGPDSVHVIRDQLAGAPERADVLLLAGDLTKSGAPEEARALARGLEGLDTRIVAVLGNHDHHSDRQAEVARIMRDAGVDVLEGDGVVVRVGDRSVGVAGVKGFGGGFTGASGSEFGEREMKSFIRHTKERADALEDALRTLDADVRIALMHYSPVRETLQGEPPEIFPFLGSYLLAEAVDRAGADLVVHGHAHRGRQHGVTPGGVNVRNVAQTVIQQAFAVYSFDSFGERDTQRRAPDDAVATPAP